MIRSRVDFWFYAFLALWVFACYWIGLNAGPAFAVALATVAAVVALWLASKSLARATLQATAKPSAAQLLIERIVGLTFYAAVALLLAQFLSFGTVGFLVLLWVILGAFCLLSHGLARLLRGIGRLRATAYGDARFASLNDKADAKLLQPITAWKGIFLGYLEGDNYPTALERIACPLWMDLRWRWLDPFTPSRYRWWPLFYDGESHLMTCAKTRSGKGRDVIIPVLLSLRDRSIFCIDPKGQNAAVTRRARGANTYCVNPFGMHTELPWRLPQHKFNPLAGLDLGSPNLIADVAGLAEALIVTESKSQPYFDNSARDLLKVLMLHVLETRGAAATLLDARAILALPYEAPPEDESLLSTLVAIRTKTALPFLRELAGRFLEDTKSIREVIQSAQAQTEFLSHVPIAEALSGDDFRMSMLKDRPTTIYVIIPGDRIAAYSRFFRLLLVSGINAITARPGGTKTLMLLDEFATACGGRLPAVENAIGYAAGYNLQLWLIVQNLNQLQEIYGEAGMNNFMSGAGVIQWFGTNDMFTAEQLSKRLGQRTIRTITGGETGVPLQTPQDLMGLGDDEQILTVAGLKYGVKAKRAPYFAFPEWPKGFSEGGGPYNWPQIDFFKARYDPDPFHPEALEATPKTGWLARMFGKHG